jgi:hypothetical protein
MLEADPEAVERCGGEAGHRARSRQAWPEVKKLFLPKLLTTYSPRYTPHDIPFGSELEEMATEFSSMARTTR